MRCIFELQFRLTCWNHRISCGMRYFYCSRTDALEKAKWQTCRRTDVSDNILQPTIVWLSPYNIIWWFSVWLVLNHWVKVQREDVNFGDGWRIKANLSKNVLVRCLATTCSLQHFNMLLVLISSSLELYCKDWKSFFSVCVENNATHRSKADLDLVVTKRIWFT